MTTVRLSLYVYCMPRKPNPKWDDPIESERFLDAAKIAEADDDPNAFDRALKKIATSKAPTEPSD